MWFIGVDVDEPNGSADDHTVTNESMSSSMQDAEDILTGRDSNLPLPCPCSETTLGSMSYASLQSYRRISNSLSSLCSISCVKSERQRKLSGVAKGITASFLLALILVIFLPDTSVYSLLIRKFLDRTMDHMSTIATAQLGRSLLPLQTLFYIVHQRRIIVNFKLMMGTMEMVTIR